MKKINKLYLHLQKTRDLEVDVCPSKENLFRESALLMNVTYIVFP